MVFEKLRAKFSLKKDVTSVKGLEKFSEVEQERILNILGTKEAELLRRKADIEIGARTRRLEQQLGLGEKKKKVGLRERSKGIREFRQKNLARRAERLKEFQKKDVLGQKLREKASNAKFNQKLEIKPFQLTNRPGGPTSQIKPFQPTVKSVNLKAPEKKL